MAHVDLAEVLELSATPASTTSAAASSAQPEPAAALARAVRTYLDHLTVERALSAQHAARVPPRSRPVPRLPRRPAASPTWPASRPRQVAAYLAALREGDDDHPPLAATSAARAISAVRGLHRFAVREGLAADDPSRDIAPPHAAETAAEGAVGRTT